MDKKTLEISWATLWRILLFVSLVAILFFGRKILLGLFLAIVISSGLDVIVNFFERRGLPRTLGVILVFLMGAVIVIFTLYAVIPLIIVDLNSVFSTLYKLGGGSFLGPFIGFRTAESASAFLNRISSQFLSGGASPLGVLSDLVGGVVLAVSILVSAFYLSLSRDGIERFIRAVLPGSQEEAALKIYDRARKRMGLWFRAQILLSVTMGLLVVGALLLLGVKHAFLLGVLAGLFELVPFVGPILAGSVAVLSGLTVSPALALYTLLVFFFLHQIENHFLVPVFMGRSVNLHPVIVIVALLIGGELGGLLGILISVPATVVLQEILEDWAGRRKYSAAAA